MSSNRKIIAQIENGLFNLLRNERERAESLEYPRLGTDYSSDKLLSRYVLPAFAKNYPVSGLHHFIGVGILAAQLTSMMNRGEEDLLVAYLAGIIHDYEKMNPHFASMPDEVKFEVMADHLLNLGLGFADEEDIARRALHIARTLETGGTRGSNLAIAQAVRVSDYILGVRNTRDAIDAANILGKYLEEKGLANLIPKPLPILLGKSRLLSMYIAQRLADDIEDKAEPLLATPTGLVIVHEERIPADLIDRIARILTDKFSQPSSMKKSSVIGVEDPLNNLKELGKKFVDQVEKGKNPGSLIGRVKSNISNYIDDIKEWFPTYSETDKRYIVIALAASVVKEKSPNSPQRAIPYVVKELGLPVEGYSWTEFIIKIREATDSAKQIDIIFNKLLKVAEDIRREKTRSAERLVPFFKREVASIVRMPLGGEQEETLEDSGESIRCTLCRNTLSKSEAYTFKNYVEAVKESVRGTIRQEIFHPDVQGAPTNTAVLEKVIDLPVCPACILEARVMPEFGITGSSWVAVLSYGPVIPYRLLKIAGKVITSEEARRALIDSLSSKIVVSNITKREGQLTKKDLQSYVSLWYVLGGSLAIVRDPLKAPDPLERVIYLERADAFFESIDSLVFERLRRAATSRRYVDERIYRLRFEVYRLLQLYIESLEENTVRGIVKLRPSLRMPKFSPGLTALALYSFSRASKDSR